MDGETPEQRAERVAKQRDEIFKQMGGVSQPRPKFDPFEAARNNANIAPQLETVNKLRFNEEPKLHAYSDWTTLKCILKAIGGVLVASFLNFALIHIYYANKGGEPPPVWLLLSVAFISTVLVIGAIVNIIAAGVYKGRHL